MNKTNGLISCVMLLIFNCSIASAFAQDLVHIDVFAEYPSAVPESFDKRITYWDLLAPQKIKMKYFPNELPANPEIAKKLFADFIASDDGKKFTEKMKDAYQSTVEMTKLRVEKIPAIVIDKKYVIYGTTDVAAAIHDYQEFKSRGGR